MTATRALWLVFLLAGCQRQLRKDSTVCPEYRDMRCMTDVECSMDSERGCRVCACRDPDDDISRQPDQGVPHPTDE